MGCGAVKYTRWDGLGCGAATVVDGFTSSVTEVWVGRIEEGADSQERC
jgi:hypothetical protein